MTIVLSTGDVLDLERGAVHAHPDGYFELELRRGIVRVPVPTYQMPRVAKVSAGYFAQRDMDLVDLFVGSEGSLGIVTDVTLRVLVEKPAFCLALIPFAHRRDALVVVCEMRDTRQSKDPRGIDISAIEHMDAASMRCAA